MVEATIRPLFGGDNPWSASDWISSDDRVRGGASQSYFKCSPYESVAHFHGILDIAALGGAGFASQRTSSSDLSLDLSNYDGIQLVIADADPKFYTLILKDRVIPSSADDRERATLSWEYTFAVGCSHKSDESLLIRIPFSKFEPTYRGKPVNEAKPLVTSNIKHLSFMLRSFFGQQSGAFNFSVESVSAYTEKVKSEAASGYTEALKPEMFPYPYKDKPEYRQQYEDEKDCVEPDTQLEKSGWFCGLCGN